MQQVRLSNVIVGVLLVAGIIFYSTSCWKDTTIGQFREQLRQEQAVSRELLETNKLLADSASNLVAQTIALDSTVDSLKARISVTQSNISRMRNQNDSLRRELQQTLPEECAPALALADRYRAEADSFRLVVVPSKDSIISVRELGLEQMKAAIALQERRAENAERDLKKYIEMNPPKDPEKFLGIKLPSRTTTLLVGVAAGIVTGAVLTN